MSGLKSIICFFKYNAFINRCFFFIHYIQFLYTSLFFNLFSHSFSSILFTFPPPPSPPSLGPFPPFSRPDESLWVRDETSPLSPDPPDWRPPLPRGKRKEKIKSSFPINRGTPTLLLFPYPPVLFQGLVENFPPPLGCVPFSDWLQYGVTDFNLNPLPSNLNRYSQTEREAPGVRLPPDPMAGRQFTHRMSIHLFAINRCLCIHSSILTYGVSGL